MSAFNEYHNSFCQEQNQPGNDKKSANLHLLASIHKYHIKPFGWCSIEIPVHVSVMKKS